MSDAMRYEAFVWMQAFHPVNAPQEIYLMFGRMIGMKRYVARHA